MKKSFKNYFSNHLKISSLTGVSSIVTSKGWFRKLIKILILCFMIAGFLLQTLEFLELYWQYSTTTITKGMSTIKKPALTICDENLLRRRVVCENIPEICDEIHTDGGNETEQCMIMEEYCLDPNDILRLECLLWLLRLPAYFYDTNVTRANGFEIEGNLLQCDWISNETQSGSLSSSCGKPEFVRAINKEKYPGACYMLKSSDHILGDDLQRDTALRMTMRWRTSDLMRQPSSILSDGTTFRYYWIAFHLPGQTVNPFLEGIRIKEGNRYSIKVSQVDSIRLAPPYSTNCFDYVNEWKMNHFEGPLGREDCQATCEINATLEAFGCVTRDIVYPHNKELCVFHQYFDHDLNVKIQKCVERCRDACKDTDYVTDIKIEDAIDIQTALQKYGAANAAIIDVSFDLSKSVTIEHKPIYESIELFSYIGGYLGIWLGWSVLALFDFFETLFNLCMYPLKRKKKQKE